MERDFKGIWIDKQIWLDERLSALEKIILMEIDSLDDGEKGCYASNEYLAEFCQCSVTKISNAISKLIGFGYISLKSFNGKVRILQSNLTKKFALDLQKVQTSLTKSVRQTYKKCKADLQKVQGYNNNINNNLEEENINNNININNNNNIYNNNACACACDSNIKYYGTHQFIHLEVSEYNQLVNEFGENEVSMIIDFLDNKYYESNWRQDKYFYTIKEHLAYEKSKNVEQQNNNIKKSE